RVLRTQITTALDLLEAQTGASIAATVPSDMLDKWRHTLAQFRPDGQIQQSWLWEAPAKHSTPQIAQVFERIDLLYSLDVHTHFGDLSDLIVRRYARQLANRPPSVGARIKEPRRTVEVACFLRYCLFTTTDQAILMIQRRVTDLWRQAKEEVPDTVNWAVLYKKLATDLAGLAAQGELAEGQLRMRVVELASACQQAKPPSRASLVRERLFEGIRPVRSLLAEIGKLPWQADEDSPILIALNQLLKLYADKARELPVEVSAPRLGRVWSAAITGDDRDKAMRALEVATLFSLRRAVRNGSVWVDHSLVFRGRARLFFTPERWAAESKRYYTRLDLPAKASTFLAPLLTRVRTGVTAVAKAAREGVLRVDDELHLSAMPAEDEDPKVILLRAQLDQRLGEVQLPEVILQVDAQVRFSWIMLGR
ncbi:MAG: Tn3 family transposase, partial [Polaromonas sp.]